MLDWVDGKGCRKGVEGVLLLSRKSRRLSTLIFVLPVVMNRCQTMNKERLAKTVVSQTLKEKRKHKALSGSQTNGKDNRAGALSRG